jgi:hypothetical protein
MTLSVAYTIVVAAVLIFLLLTSFLYMLRRSFEEWQQLFLSFRELFNSSRTPSLILDLLKIVIPADDELENIIGDLEEEYNQISPTSKANLWLYKQVLKSVLPLVYKNLKGRLSSYFKERIR